LNYDQDKDKFSSELIRKIEENEKLKLQLNEIKQEFTDMTKTYGDLLNAYQTVERQLKTVETEKNHYDQNSNN